MLSSQKDNFTKPTQKARLHVRKPGVSTGVCQFELEVIVLSLYDLTWTAWCNMYDTLTLAVEQICIDVFCPNSLYLCSFKHI